MNRSASSERLANHDGERLRRRTRTRTRRWWYHRSRQHLRKPGRRQVHRAPSSPGGGGRRRSQEGVHDGYPGGALNALFRIQMVVVREGEGELGGASASIAPSHRSEHSHREGGAHNALLRPPHVGAGVPRLHHKRVPIASRVVQTSHFPLRARAEWAKHRSSQFSESQTPSYTPDLFDILIPEGNSSLC